ncbi:hypothetical protein K1T71_010815 [Dendrolimus kikuchii]|uniref:Uncharacterized protein n=1 Tax=Dendrolimus kikuchii TaxID=765133 RepID=A0ACC1CQ55_9NEOP|nr:hypothetical protein K1T71_010815 [Dendrolimus kikuchii]
MLKLFIHVILCNILLLQIECLKLGDSCSTLQNQSGICTPLSSCQHLREEIARAGNPMPRYMMKKLGKPECGFEGSEPIVCCVANQIGNPFNISSRFRNVTNNGNPNDISQHPNVKFLPTLCGTTLHGRVFGGAPTQMNEMPWMVLLSYVEDSGRKLRCAGTLINEWYVLTAAHCVIIPLANDMLNGVILGEYDVTTDRDCNKTSPLQCALPTRKVNIDRVKVHPNYTINKQTDDIALIKLSEPVNPDVVTTKPICLPITREMRTMDLKNKTTVVAGWGMINGTQLASVLMSVELPIISKLNCEKSYKTSFSNGQMCAGGEENKNVCLGDSGGPLMLKAERDKYVQHGIASFGMKDCPSNGYPGIFTRVAYYMDWILTNIQD